MESYSKAIQIAEDPIKRRTDGASAFNTRAARGRLLLLDPARREEKLRESSNSRTAWWWREAWYSNRALPSSREEDEVLEGEGAAPRVKGCAPLPPPPFI
jgi:hypothetical protein